MPKGRRGYFKVQDTIFGRNYSNDTLATLVRLMAWMNQRWARDGLTIEQAAKCTLSTRVLMQITGKGRADAARKNMSLAASISSMSARHQADITLIDWPKFAQFQYVRGEIGASAYATPTPEAPTHPQEAAEVAPHVARLRIIGAPTTDPPRS